MHTQTVRSPTAHPNDRRAPPASVPRRAEQSRAVGDSGRNRPISGRSAQLPASAWSRATPPPPIPPQKQSPASIEARSPTRSEGTRSSDTSRRPPARREAGDLDARGANGAPGHATPPPSRAMNPPPELPRSLAAQGCALARRRAMACTSRPARRGPNRESRRREQGAAGPGREERGRESQRREQRGAGGGRKGGERAGGGSKAQRREGGGGGAGADGSRRERGIFGSSVGG